MTRNTKHCAGRYMLHIRTDGHSEYRCFECGHTIDATDTDSIVGVREGDRCLRYLETSKAGK